MHGRPNSDTSHGSKVPEKSPIKADMEIPTPILQRNTRVMVRAAKKSLLVHPALLYLHGHDVSEPRESLLLGVTLARRRNTNIKFLTCYE
jgi:hypothetical protein